MRLPLAAGLFAGALLLLTASACSSERTYDTTKKPDDYDLASMRLLASDVPGWLADDPLPNPSFDNATWAGVLSGGDQTASDAKQKELEGQGRIRSYVTSYTAPAFYRILAVTSISTLYKDAASADKAIPSVADASSGKWKTVCDIPIADGTPLDVFTVSGLGEHALAFSTPRSAGNNQPLVDVSICFRTGNILNVVQQTTLPEVEDVALNVRLAKTMLQHVNDSFDGKKAPPVETPTAAPTDASGPAGPQQGTATTGSGASGTTTSSAPSTTPAASGTSPAGTATAAR